MFIKNGLNEDEGHRACHNCIDLDFHKPINFIRRNDVKKFTFPIKQSKYEKKSQKNITLKLMKKNHILYWRKNTKLR